MSNEILKYVDECYVKYYNTDIINLDGVILSGLDDIIIPKKHFDKFPWDEFDINDYTMYSVGCGGYPLKDYEMTFDLFMCDKDQNVHPLLKQYRWVVPESLKKLIDHYFERGKKHKINELKNILKL